METDPVPMQSTASASLTKRWRVAACITDLDPGGAEKALVQVLTRFDPEQWEIAVYCLGPEAELAPILRENGITVECYGAKRATDGFGAILWCYHKLSVFKPDLLQTFLFHGNFIGRLAASLARVPIVVAGHRVAEREHKWHLTCEWLTRRMVTHHVAVSQSVANHLQQHCRIAERSMSVISNGVEINADEVPCVDFDQFYIPTQNRVIISVGRLVRQKGFSKLIDAFSRVNLPETSLVIVGDGPLKSNLKRQITRLGIKDRVHLVGYQKESLSLIKSADLFVLSSLWEGMPNVVLEAMALKCPVIATAVAGIPELLDDGNAGIIVTPDDVEGLTAAIATAMSDLEAMKLLVNHAQFLVNKEFTWERVQQDYEQLYLDLLNPQLEASS